MKNSVGLFVLLAVLALGLMAYFLGALDSSSPEAASGPAAVEAAGAPSAPADLEAVEPVAPPPEPRASDRTVAVAETESPTRSTAPAAVVVVLVVDAERTPIPGAQVDLFAVEAMSGPTATVADARSTDAEGRAEFSLAELPTGELGAQAQADGYGARFVRVDLDGEKVSTVIVLSPGATVVGQFEAIRGTLPARAKLRFMQGPALSRSTREFHAPLRDDGRFAISAPDAGSYEVVGHVPGLGSSQSIGVSIPEAGLVDLGLLTMEAGASISGRLMFVGGEPIDDVSVHAQLTTETAANGLTQTSARSTADGSFELVDLAAGTYSLFVDSTFTPIGGPFEGYSAPSTGVELAVDGWMLEVRCIDEEGSPVRFGSVESGPVDPESAGYSMSSSGFSPTESWTAFRTRTPFLIRSTATDGRTYGTIVDEGLPAGHHRVDLAVDDPRLARLRVRVGGREIEPDEELTVTVSPTGDGGAMSQQDGDEGASEIRLSGLLPGTYRVAVSAGVDKHVIVEVPDEEIELVAGTEATVDAVSYLSATLTLTFVDPGGAASDRRATCRIRAVDSSEWTTTTLVVESENRRSYHSSVAPTGTVRVNHPLTGGVYEVEVAGEGLATELVRVSVVGGETVDVPIEIRTAE